MKAIFIFVFVLNSVAAFAQSPATESENPLDDLGFLVGNWQGSGWILNTNGKFPLISTEIVQKKAGDRAILIEGLHREKLAGDQMGEIVFEAIALVTYNSENAHFDWRSATDKGRGGNFKAQIIGKDSLLWGLENNFRYIITLDEEGRWHEIGEFTRDNGNTWVQFFEMTLNKKD